MSALAEALKDLKQEIEAKGFSQELVDDLAEEYDLKSALLIRKFEDQYGKPASEWKKPVPVKPTEEVLLNIARQYWKQNLLIGRPEDSAFFGKYVEIEGGQYMTVAYVAGNTLLVVNTDNGRKSSFVWNRKAGIQSFLRNNL